MTLSAAALSCCPQPEQMGELCFSLRYVPSSGHLTVVVLEARGLNPGISGKSYTGVDRGLGPCVQPSHVRVWDTPLLNFLVHVEPFVKVQLMLNQRKWKKKKTSSKKNTTMPYFNETFTFLVPFSQLQVRSGEEGQSGLGLRAGSN